MSLIAGLLLLVTLIQNSGAASERVQDYLQRAAQAEQAADYAAAAEAYRQILALVPNSAEIHQKLGLALHLQNDFTAAIESFQKALKLDPNLEGSTLFLGIGYYKTNRFGEAVPLLEQSASSRENRIRTEALFWLGATCRALGRYDSAITHFLRTLEGYPDRLEVLHQLVQSHQQYAISYFENLMVHYPGFSYLHQLRAESHQAAGRISQAVEEYETAISLAHGRTGLHGALARLLLQLDEPQQAAEHFRRELEINPFSEQARQSLRQLEKAVDTQISSPEPWQEAFLKALVDFDGGRFDAALRQLTGCLGPNLLQKDCRLLSVRCLAELGRTESALKEAEEISETNTAGPEVLYTLGRMHEALARSRLEEMVTVDPTSYRVQQMLGEAHEREERYSDALEAYQSAFELRPDAPGIRFSIGSIHWKTRRFEEAQKWLEEELNLNPHHALAHYQLGGIFLLQSQPEKAVRHLQETLRGRPDFTEAHRELGKAFLQLGRLEDALEAFQSVAAAFPEDPAIYALLARTLQKMGRSQEARTALKRHEEITQARLIRLREQVQK